MTPSVFFWWAISNGLMGAIERLGFEVGPIVGMRVMGLKIWAFKLLFRLELEREDACGTFPLLWDSLLEANRHTLFLGKYGILL